jgi:hypothetical protein
MRGYMGRRGWFGGHLGNPEGCVGGAGGTVVIGMQPVLLHVWAISYLRASAVITP